MKGNTDGVKRKMLESRSFLSMKLRAKQSEMSGNHVCQCKKIMFIVAQMFEQALVSCISISYLMLVSNPWNASPNYINLNLMALLPASGFTAIVFGCFKVSFLLWNYFRRILINNFLFTTAPYINLLFLHFLNQSCNIMY